MRIMKKFLCAASFCVGSLPAMASSLIWDWSPLTTGATVTNDFWTNRDSGQHFADRVSFGNSMNVSAMDIYSSDQFGSAGSAVKITIWNDVLGLPGAVLGQFSSVISAVDSTGAAPGNNRKHAEFGGFTMSANTPYWIGMAGDNYDLTQTGLSGIPGGDSVMAQFTSNEIFINFTDSFVGDMAFRLYGDATTETPLPQLLPLVGVPLPAAGWFLGTGLLGLLGMARKRPA